MTDAQLDPRIVFTASSSRLLAPAGRCRTSMSSTEPSGWSAHCT